MEKQRILIADDNEINRLLVSSMLQDKYELLHADNGAEAIAIIQNYHGDIDLVLLDLIMPVMDGIEVLKEMSEQGWTEDIPVIVISAETSFDYTRKAYTLGAEDYINRPFDPETVSRRIEKAILLHSERKNLTDALAEEYKSKEIQSNMMINILSHVVEQRNGESGLHVIHIKIITALLLKELLKRTDKYDIKEEDIPIICNAASLHDIGKIAIPEKVLNKPGKYTPEEYEIMKTHSMIGYEMISRVTGYGDQPLLKYARNICRYHHERWNGKGYPDGLRGDEIPIEAQIVAIADVYDALTSERCYKEAYSHDEAMKIILAGECGGFNQALVDCLKSIGEPLRDLSSMKNNGDFYSRSEEELLNEQTINKINTTKNADISRNIRLLRSGEQRNEAFWTLTEEAWFEYYAKPTMIKFNPAAKELLGLPAQVIDPFNNKQFLDVCGTQLRGTFSLDGNAGGTAVSAAAGIGPGTGKTVGNTDSETTKKDKNEVNFAALGLDNNEPRNVENIDKIVEFANGNKYHIKGTIFISQSSDGNVRDYISGAIGRINLIK